MDLCRRRRNDIRIVHCLWLFSAVLLTTTTSLVLTDVVNRTDFVVSTTLRSSLTSEQPPVINVESSCAEIRHLYAAKMLGSVDVVPKQPISGSDLRICESERSCCTPVVENKFKEIVKQELLAIVQSTSSYLRNLLTRNTELLQERFLDLIKVSENKTILIFDELYKQMAIQTQDLISRMYNQLGEFIGEREVNVDDAVATFFDDLFPHVYHRIINPKLKDFNADYKDCLKRTRVETKPFGDIPTQIVVMLTKTFLATRTFVDALRLGVEVMETLNELEVAPECEVALHKLLYCPKCQGLVEARACNGYCSNVIRGCLANVAEMDQPWNDYLKALEKLAAGMESGSVMNNVASELPSKISEAVMHAMDNGPKISKKVKDACGHPKRDGQDYGGASDTNFTVETSAITTQLVDSSLYPTIRGFMKSLGQPRNFFGSLAETVCHGDSLAVRSESNCWNGQTLGEYTKTIAGVGLSAQKYNPELKSPQFKDTKFALLIEKVKQTRKELDSKAGLLPEKNAVFVNDGSGSGWAGYPDNEHTDDEDYGDGSGSGDYDVGPDESKGEIEKDDEDLGFTEDSDYKPSIEARPPSGAVTLVNPLSWLLSLPAVIHLFMAYRWTSG